MLNRPKTIICDIDGTLVRHNGNLSQQILTQSTILPGAIEKLNEWDLKGYRIILMTGRKESMRKKTEQQLEELGIFYDQLIMGVTNGERILINDLKSDGLVKTASAICVKRNEGIDAIDV
jgi:hydroxymethylpyrimidine pyrophosphatase-like HAD family hydrolase